MTEFAASAADKGSISQLLVFGLQDISFGVDTRQVAGISDPKTIDQDEIEILKLCEMIPFKDQPVHYRSPKALVVKTSLAPKAVYVEAPDDIIFLKYHDIKPIPALISKLNVTKAIWGVFTREERTILVVDLYCLIAEALESKLPL